LEKTKTSIFKNELEAVIQQISTIELEPKPEPSSSANISNVVDAETQKEKNNASHNEREEIVCSIENDAADSFVSARMLQCFKELSKDPNLLPSPLQLADILFQVGCLDEAAICYSEALNRLGKDEWKASQDKAWILLQLGNCLAHKEPGAASEKYQLVLEESPYSPWAELAKGKADLITWYLKDQPRTQLKELESQAANTLK
jgi:tetratricopeptide (TPR) repeat protein